MCHSPSIYTHHRIMLFGFLPHFLSNDLLVCLRQSHKNGDYSLYCYRSFVSVLELGPHKYTYTYLQRIGSYNYRFRGKFPKSQMKIWSLYCLRWILKKNYKCICSELKIKRLKLSQYNVLNAKNSIENTLQIIPAPRRRPPPRSSRKMNWWII